MKPISASGSFILFLITALSVKAGSLANDSLPHREASLTSVDVPRQKKGLVNSPTDFKVILPVEVDVSDLVSNFNVRFQALGDNVTRLGDQLRIIEEENARAQNALKEEVAQCEANAESAKVTKLKTQLQALRKKLKASKKKLSKCNACSRNKCVHGTCKENKCKCEYGYTGEYCNEELNLCETLPERKEDHEFGCYGVEMEAKKSMPKCWRMCTDADGDSCGPHGWCNIDIDHSKCTQSQIKKADCVEEWWHDDPKACPPKWNEYYCDDRVGVTYACTGKGRGKCWRSCNSGEEGCNSSGWCYVNAVGMSWCAWDTSCKIGTEYPCQ